MLEMAGFYLKTTGFSLQTLALRIKNPLTKLGDEMGLFNARNVFAGTGINADNLADLNEEWHANYRAGA